MLTKAQTSKDITTSSIFWRETTAAIRSGKYETWFELSVHEKAWIIAAFESTDTIQQVIDYVNEPNNDS